MSKQTTSHLRNPPQTNLAFINSRKLMGETDYFPGAKHGHFSNLSRLGVMSYRDLERRQLWDVNAIQRTLILLSGKVQSRIHSQDNCKRDSFKSKLRKGINAGNHLLAGAFSAAVCKTVVAPIERIRMDIILRNTEQGPIGACLEVLRREGVSGFWRGNLLNILRTAPFKAINFYTFDVYSRTLLMLTGRQDNGDWERFTAGALAGITAVLTCLPLDTIRTRLLSSNSLHQYSGFADCFGQIVRKEGVTGLYKGCLPGVLSIGPGSAVFYGVYGSLKQAHLNREQSCNEGIHERLELPVMNSLLYGAIAGMCAEAVVYPLEVIKRQIQLQTTTGTVALCSNGLHGSTHSLLQACSTIVKTQGFGGFYAGVMLNSVQVLPSAALSYFTYEAVKSALQVDKPVATNH